MDTPCFHGRLPFRRIHCHCTPCNDDDFRLMLVLMLISSMYLSISLSLSLSLSLPPSPSSLLSPSFSLAQSQIHASRLPGACLQLPPGPKVDSQGETTIGWRGFNSSPKAEPSKAQTHLEAHSPPHAPCIATRALLLWCRPRSRRVVSDICGRHVRRGHRAWCRCAASTGQRSKGVDSSRSRPSCLGEVRSRRFSWSGW